MAMVNDADSLKWGYLVKSWATGLDYVSPPVTRIHRRTLRQRRRHGCCRPSTPSI